MRRVAWLTERELWLALLAALALWALAYQTGGGLTLAVGGDAAAQRRKDDAPYLTGFNDPQPTTDRDDPREWWALPEPPYRWATEQAELRYPGAGGGRWLLTLTAVGQPTDRPTLSRWDDGHAALEVALPRAPRTYHMLVRPDGLGDLRLTMQTAPFAAPADPRSLGFVLRQVTLAPLGAPQRPALGALALLALALTAGYGTARLLGAPRRWMLAGALAAALLAALLLALARPPLTVFLPTLAALAGVCLAVAGIFSFTTEDTEDAESDHQTDPILRSAVDGRRSMVRNALLGLALLAFALRLGGVLHPNTIQSDTGLNANNLRGLVQGAVYITEDLPARAGGGAAPYPPGQYVLLAPLSALLPGDDDARRLLVQTGGAALDALVLLLLGLTLLRAGTGRHAALFGAALYLLPRPILQSFSVGEYANLAGQALALPALLLLGLAADRLRDRSVWLLALALLLFALTGHSGVTISVALTLAALVPLAVLFHHRGRRVRGDLLAEPSVALPLLAYVGLCAAAALLAGVFLYSAFLYVYLARAGAAPPSAAVAAGGALTRLRDLVLGLDGGRTLISPLLLLLGALGVWLMRHSGLRRLLLAWWLATAAAILPLLVTNQTVRWSAFFYPALCLGGGVALAALWRRGRLGAALALLALLALLAQGLFFWVTQLREYLH